MVNKSVLFLFLLISFISCKNYYNNTLRWMENIPENAPIEYVQKHQPGFVEVDWGNPEIHDGRVYY